MSRANKSLRRVLGGKADSNFGFDELRSVMQSLGFDERVRGSHHIFTREGIPEIVNLQPKGHQAKAYQVRQVRELIERYDLVERTDEGPDEDEHDAT